MRREGRVERSVGTDVKWQFERSTCTRDIKSRRDSGSWASGFRWSYLITKTFRRSDIGEQRNGGLIVESFKTLTSSVFNEPNRPISSYRYTD